MQRRRIDLVIPLLPEDVDLPSLDLGKAELTSAENELIITSEVFVGISVVVGLDTSEIK